jgi:outer membrane lipopolysaccharide assembly protein LptE/RlpB
LTRGAGTRRQEAGIAGILAALLATAGCGYALVGQGSSLPPNIQVVEFTTLENRTQRVGLEQRLSGEITRELVSRGRFKVQASSAGADAALTGAVLAFNLYPVSFDSQGRATDYQVSITARVALNAVPGGEPIWENPAFTFRGNYQFNETAATFSDRENDAIDRVADRFAQSLVTSMLEGF